MSDERTATPAYISYATFKSTIRGFTHDKKPPSRIDKSVLVKMSGSGQAQFLGALRFLDCVDDAGKPTLSLISLCASDEAGWKSAMDSILKSKYPAQLLALKEGTPATFRESFPATFTEMGASIIAPAARFLYSAAKDIGLPISGHITEIADSRHARRTPSGDKELKSTKTSEQMESGPATQSRSSFEEKLLDKFPSFDPDWDEKRQTAWFAAYERLLALGGKGATL